MTPHDIPSHGAPSEYNTTLHEEASLINIQDAEEGLLSAITPLAGIDDGPPTKLRKSPVGVIPIPGCTEKSFRSKWHDDVIIGFDAEWQLEDKKGRRNRILSYQVAVLIGDNVWSQVLYPEDGGRLTLDEIVGAALQAVNQAGALPDTPTKVYLVAHWTAADFRSLRDFSVQKTTFDGLRGSFVTLRKPSPVTVTDSTGEQKVVAVYMRDSKLLAPAGKQSLEALGNLIGFPKIELPPGTIEKMGDFLAEAPAEFESYAVRDAQISAIYLRHVADLLSELSGERRVLPVALGGIAESACTRLLKAGGVDLLDLLGKERIPHTDWSSGKPRQRPMVLPKRDVYVHHHLACEAFHGGRNETFTFGATSEDDWTDMDLSSAYPTALCSLRTPDWDNMRCTLEPRDFKADELGFALAEVEFPPHVRFPGLPVRTEGGLVFPQRGCGFLTSPEIVVALKLGATVRVSHGVVIPAKDENRPFQHVFGKLIEERKRFPKGSLGELMFKEISNSIYGKIGQGLKRRMAFNTRSNDRHRMPASGLTNPYIAAFTTGFIRAVLAEILNALPPHVTVVSVTTDGFLGNSSLDNLAASTSGPLCKVYSEVRGALTGEPSAVPLEKKRSARQVLGWRRRGQATLLSSEDRLILAKAGLKPPSRVEEEQNRWIVEQFKARQFGTKFTYEHLPSLYELYQTEVDLVSYEKTRVLKMDYDFARRPVNLHTRSIEGVPHVAFDTIPWTTAEEAVRARQEWADFSKARKVVMRDESVVREFLERLAILPRATAKRAVPLKLAIRQFLRAYRKGLWGLTPDFSGRRNKKTSDWLVTNGYKVSVRDVENAGRSDINPEEQWVPRTPETLKFVATVKARWPEFREGLLFETLTPTPEEGRS